MSNTSVILNNLDFDTIKNTFKTYLRSQDRFKDYDFDGSNISVLLDVLSYNTFHNAFYLNMVGNEMFIDSAVIRDSVVSHAKELNYTPRSFTSAVANVSILATTNNATRQSITIPKGFTFSSQFGAKFFTFTTAENIIIDKVVPSNEQGKRVFVGNDIPIYEGYYLTDTFVYHSINKQRMIITNQNVDVSSISVTVIEDLGATVETYKRVTSLFDVDEKSKIFFVQGAENETYEILFGDGVTGKLPKDNSTIVVEYRISNGELPNGCNKFTTDNRIQTESNESLAVNVVTNIPATGGSVSESIESIKFNAPRHFTTQERAVTSEDYENLLKLSFPEINTVTAFGGEDLSPPQFGKVFVSVDLNDTDGLPDVKKQEYYRFLKPRCSISIDPVFIDPEYTYLNIESTVRYNRNITLLTVDDIKTIVTSAILSYAKNNLNNFNKVFRYSKCVQAIDNSQTSIVSNETNIRMIKLLKPKILGSPQTFDINFDVALDSVVSRSDIGFTVQSSAFIYEGQRAVIRDNGDGKLLVCTDGTLETIDTIGTVNYDNGLLQFSNFTIDNTLTSGVIKVYATPLSRDTVTRNNTILNIVQDDIDLRIVPIRA